MAPQSTHIHSWDEFQGLVQKLKIVPKYNAASEKKTPHPWWDLDKEKINAILEEISEVTTSSTKGATGLDRELQHVTNTATMLKKVDRAPTIKVALKGAQGAGKSLLINALFDCKGLSLTGANGACTSVIIKYAYCSGDRYTAEVQFLDAKMTEETIDEHIKSYVHYHNDLEDSDNEDGPKVRSLSQDQIEEKLKKTAEDFFDTIFGSRDEFLTAWSSSPVNTGEFKSLCQLKCKEAMENYDITYQGVAHFSKSSPEELLEKIKPFVSSVTNGHCLWPIVKHVTIRHDHPLLQGLEIIDLPGSGDINLSRARHADEIKDSVDVEMILGDTIRITTDSTVLSNARSGLLTHGASNVKILATKIDAISDNQLTQCKGVLYDEIKSLIQQAETDAATAEEEGEDAKATQIGRYKLYLERCLKTRMIEERAKDISTKFENLLRGRSNDQVEVIHTSTADYMLWIKNDKILFKDQPALDPEGTGVPAVRRFLYNLPAPQGMLDYSFHINTAVPAFIDKLKRVVTQSDRDAGFRTIADDFDNLRTRFLHDMFELIKWHYLVYSKKSISKIKKDASAYKTQVENKLVKNWLLLKSPAFTRLVRNRGTVLRGVSRAKGLENGVNWNAELASILEPGFLKWHALHTEQLHNLKCALPMGMVRLYKDTVKLMNESAANLVTVEKAKNKWKPYSHRMQSKLTAMMDEMLTEEKRLLHRATLKDERENNVISSITDSIYDDVFNSSPALKATPPGKPKRYVTPKLKFQKALLEKHFLDSNAHFVDKVIAAFQTQLEDKMTNLVDKHSAKLSAMLNEFSTLLREHAPVDYTIDSLGESIREELEKRIPEIEHKAKELQGLLPKMIKSEDDDMAAAMDNVSERCDAKDYDLTYFLELVKKRKHTGGQASMMRDERDAEFHAKRVKLEE